MDKTKLNFFIDALMFLTMMALAGLGLLIKYVLIPGRIAWAQYGRQMELTWLGLDRHAWGAVHLYLAFLLLSLLLLHVILHGKMILGLFTRFISDPTLRKGSAPAFLLLSLVLLAFPLLVTPEVNEVGLRENKRLGAASAPEGLTLAATSATRGEQDKIDLSVQSAVSEQAGQSNPPVEKPSGKNSLFRLAQRALLLFRLPVSSACRYRLGPPEETDLDPHSLLSAPRALVTTRTQIQRSGPLKKIYLVAPVLYFGVVIYA